MKYPRARPGYLAVVAALAMVSGCGTAHSVLTNPIPGPTSLPSNYRIELDSLLQTPRFIQNSEALGASRPGAPAPFPDSVAFQIVRQFVIRYASVFRLRPGIDDFVPLHGSHGADGTNHVKIGQTYRGLRVDYGGYGTSVLSNRHVAAMIGRFLPDIQVSTIPVIDSDVAQARSIAALTPKMVKVFSAPELVIANDGTLTSRLAWSTIVSEGWASWTVRVDAHTGRVLTVAPNFIIG